MSLLLLIPDEGLTAQPGLCLCQGDCRGSVYSLRGQAHTLNGCAAVRWSQHLSCALYFLGTKDQSLSLNYIPSTSLPQSLLSLLSFLSKQSLAVQPRLGLNL